MPLTRRTLLKAALSTAAALCLPAGLQRATASDAEGISYNERFGYPPLLGRVADWWLPVMDQPDGKTVIRWLEKHEVIPIYGGVHKALANPYRAHNDLWYDTGDGYVYSAWVQPAREQFYPPQPVPEGGFWAEVSVPCTQIYWEPRLRTESKGYYKLPFGSVYRVLELAGDETGRDWYRLYQDQKPQGIWWWVQAAHLHPLSAADFDPISPDVPAQEKIIRVSLTGQTLICYEGDQMVFSTLIASGSSDFGPDGQVIASLTPFGEFTIIRKTPSRHMIGGERGTTRFYDLPGVPWCSFFNGAGDAIHGCYWHNDFGAPHSHGCLNVSNDAARWIYRWSNPVTGPDDPDRWLQGEELRGATRVVIT